MEQTHIRSYKLRSGRVTEGQAQARAELWESFGLMVDGRPLDLDALFGRRGRRVLEIGSGMGDATAAMAAAAPGDDVLAVEVHLPGIGHLLRLVHDAGLTNVRVAEGDAVLLLRDMLGPDSVEEVRVFFPDPWPKARHEKRRLISTPTLDLLASRVARGGLLHVATDWEEYADRVRSLIGQHPSWSLVERESDRPATRFEQRAVRAGRASYDLFAERV